MPWLQSEGGLVYLIPGEGGEEGGTAKRIKKHRGIVKVVVGTRTAIENAEKPVKKWKQKNQGALSRQKGGGTVYVCVCIVVFSLREIIPFLKRKLLISTKF